MKISIVTTCFNQAQFVADAIESVLRQDYANLEYIVVDPGSTDGSREIIQSFGAGVAISIFEKDAGASDGLNKGFTRSTGEVLGFLNADDMLLPGSLHTVARFFEERNDRDIAAGNGWIIDGTGKPLRHIRARHISASRYLHGQRQWIQQSIFFRREAFLGAGGFNPRNRTCWDGELFLHMMQRGARIGYIDVDLAAFRIHSGSLTGAGQNGAEYRRECQRVFRQATGRNWTIADSALRCLYRLESGLLHMIDFDRFRYRESKP